MTFSIKVSIQDSQPDIKLTNSEINRVNRQAANQLVAAIKRRTGGEIPKAAKIGIVGYRRVRTHKTSARARGKNRQLAVAWVGGNNVAARFGGRMRQKGTTAYAGRTLFRNSFKASVRNGNYTSIWKRLANGKLEEQVIPLIDFRRDVQAIAKEEFRGVNELLKNELSKVLASKARRLNKRNE